VNIVRKSMWLKLVVVGITMSLLLGMPVNSNAAENVLRIGVVGPESGGSAQLGQGQRNAAQLAVDEINASGAAGDWKLEVYFEDDQGNPTQATNVTMRLIQQNNVHIILGAINSSATLAAMVITEREGIPQICAGSTGASITQQGSKWIFRTAVNDAYQADALAKYAKDTLGLTKVASFTAADDYGQSGAVLLADAAKKYDLEMVTQQTYNGGDIDFKPQLISIINAEAEGIFMWGIYTEAALISIQSRQLGFEGQLFGASGMASQRLIDLSAEAGQGLILTQSFLPSSEDENVTKFVSGFMAKYNESPIPHGAQAYDSMYIIANAIKKANTTDPEKLRDAISETQGLSMVTGTPQFNEFGDDTGKRVLITKIQGDEFVLVEVVSTGVK